jgi:predicted ATPase
MKIKSVHLKEFKRFKELWIRDIPETVSLVVLVGPNGSGKSCIFDAFNLYLNLSKGTGLFDASYHIKSDSDPTGSINSWRRLCANVNIVFYDFSSGDVESWLKKADQHKKAFYIRSSYRHEADFSVRSISTRGDILNDEVRPLYLISPDNRVSDNYQRIVARAVEEIYGTRKTAEEIRERLINSIGESLRNVLIDLELIGPGNPLEDGTFYFKKGATKDWRYKNLSGGEKSAFDLLLDFLFKIEKFNDTVFCIDEPELHMHNNAQARLLEELVRNLPQKCQLWIATHSIGTMRKAKELSEAKPGTVVFLDFDQRDFDQTVEIRPAVTNRAFWKRLFAVSLGDLADLIAPKELICCEGSPTRGGEFDAKCYRKIFELEFPDVDFISLGGASEVEKNSLLISSILGTVLSRVKLSKVIDRDDRGQAQVDELKSKGLRVLSLRHLENYLYDDEILKKLCKVNGKEAKVSEVLSAKAAALASSMKRGNPSDDFKSMSGELYNYIKRILDLTQCGNDSEAFCIETLMPLVSPDTEIYNKLRTDIFS